VAGFDYVVASAVALTVPPLAGVITPIGMALGAGELPMGISLLVWGVRDQHGRIEARRRTTPEMA
jgi:hypothetical protein